MSFFGFEQNDLEQERRKFLEGTFNEDIAVYNWGEENYDGLGDVLQEGGDELNDETFGGAGAVGKDFDFSKPALPDFNHPSGGSSLGVIASHEVAPSREAPQPSSTKHGQPPASLASYPSQSLEGIWDDKSPFSVLPRVNGGGRPDQARASPSFAAQTRFSPFSIDDPVHSAQPLAHGIGQSGVRTLEEIEAEMRLAAQQSRAAEQRQYQLLQQQILERRKEEGEQLLYQQQQQQLREQELHRQRLHQQEQMQRLLQQQQQQQQLQQASQIQHMRTPPPRMLPVSRSPRFLEQQRHLLLLQQEQQLQLQELQEQLRYEEMERQMVARFNQQMNINTPVDNRPPSASQLTEIQLAHLLQQQHLQDQSRQRSRSPVIRNPQYPAQVPEQGLAYQSQNIQVQQRLLSELAQAEFLREMQAPHADQEALRAEAMRKIVEAEKMEEKRRRKAAKIAHMARYNDLMTQSDKDFITRIQVSQLVTQDPYADDFYAQVYGAILRSRLGLQSQDERVLKFGSGGGVGLGVAQKGGNRRPSAMQRMEQQVERIVNNARRREEEKGLHALHSLQGALGRTSGRSYKAAPRQLLQVDGGSGTSPTGTSVHAFISKNSILEGGAAREAAKLGREALGSAAGTDNLVKKEPLSHREVLIVLELLYDLVLQVEQLRRDQPPQGEEEALAQWEKEYDELVDQVWDNMRVMEPLETSNPHPFVSILSATKGKKLLPRLTRHLDHQRMLTLLTLVVACFSQLDVVVHAPLLDSLQETRERNDADRQTQAFLGSVLQSILPIVAKASLRLITGLLGLLLDRTNVAAIAQTKPGLALLTLFLSRVEVIKQSMANATEIAELPTQEEAEQWQLIFDHLFELLAPHFLILFPSTRIALAINPGQAQPPNDIVDQPVWQFLAALALHAVTEQHQILVTALREKVLDNITTAKEGWAAGDPEWETRLANVNLFLHALGLDSSQIAM
ncbi:hypothetical protein BDN72DRAFT_817099 [Pluteus cervinus]|uniref:Uncharacterized protein n=1 Tax=Pluteus cervinus TaxID=181527 RepID=A0ACD3B0Q5_9AGAR|nr:hypothetical protein BDN72DRAFT_817099 [Pluteus cervinus]